MEFVQIERDLKSKNFKPIYLLMGEEPFYIDQITELIEDLALTEDEKAFNLTISYGKETAIEDIVNAAKRFPMMAERQVVIVKEAQELKKLDAFEKYFEQPTPSTVLVLAHKYKKVDKRSKIYKLASKNGVAFTSEKIKDYLLSNWITKLVTSKGFKITDKASMMLSEFLGNDLSRINNEIEKLAIILEKGAEITDEIVEKNIGISKDFNIFELTNAIGDMNIIKANRIIDYFDHNPKAGNIVPIISQLFSFYQRIMKVHFLPNKTKDTVAKALKVHPYVAGETIKHSNKFNPKVCARNIAYLAEYDLKSKGIGNSSFSSGDLLKELIFKLMH